MILQGKDVESVRSLAEEEREKVGVSDGLFQLIDNAAEQHRLALAGSALDPQQPVLFVIAPSLEVGIVEDPAVRAPLVHLVRSSQLADAILIAWPSLILDTRYLARQQF